MPGRERVILSPESTLFSPQCPPLQERTVQQKNRLGAQCPIHRHHTRCVDHVLFPTAMCQALQSSLVRQLIHWHSSTLQPAAGAVGWPALHAAPAWQPPWAASMGMRGQDHLLSATAVQVIQQGWTCPGTSTHSNCITIRIMRIKTPTLTLKTHRKPSVPLMQTHLCSASGIAARMPQQMQLRHQLLMVFSGLPI